MLASLPRKLSIVVPASFASLLFAELLTFCAEPGSMSLYDETPFDRGTSLPCVLRPSARTAWNGTYHENNARDWRGPEFERTCAHSELRVLAIGDSCTFGKGVDESDTWPRQLGRMPREELRTSRTVLVGKLGVNGYSGRDYLEVFATQVRPIRDDIAVLACNFDDFPNVLQKVDRAVLHSERNLRPRIAFERRSQLGQLALFRWARATYDEQNRERDLQQVETIARGAAGELHASTNVLQAKAARLARLVETCNAIGADVLMFLRPYESQVYLDEHSPAPPESSRAIAEPLWIASVDLVEPFRSQTRSSDPPPRSFVRGDRYHPNASGYEVIARNIGEKLERRAWLGGSQ